MFLSESSVPAEVVAAVDVNTTANEIYKHNFPTTPLLPKTIEVSLCPLESYLVLQMIRHILFGRIHINTKWRFCMAFLQPISSLCQLIQKNKMHNLKKKYDNMIITTDFCISRADLCHCNNLSACFI